jgi:hypothetical protein
MSLLCHGLNSRLQSQSENRTVRISNGHFSDTFSVRFSDAKNKMAAIIDSHFAKTIRKPDKKVRFSNGFAILLKPLKTGPFGNRTKIESKNRLRFSFQVVTVIPNSG